MMFEKQGSGSRTEQKPNSHDARHAVMMLASWGRWSSTDAADADSPTKVCAGFAAEVVSKLRQDAKQAEARNASSTSG